MADFSKQRMNDLLNLLSANGFKVQRGFDSVLNVDYSGAATRYDLVCKAVERIDFLAHDCLNHGPTRDKKSDILVLSKCCVKLTKSMRPGKQSSISAKIEQIAGRDIETKATVDVRGDLLTMLKETVTGLNLAYENDPESKRAPMYKEVAEFLSDLAERIGSFYDNYSKEAAAHSRKTYEIVFTQIRGPLGSNALTKTELNKRKEELNAEADAWSKLVRAKRKRADENDIKPNISEESKGNDEWFIALTKVKEYLEKLDQLYISLEEYQEQTDELCDISEFKQSKEELNKQIEAEMARIPEIKAKVDAKRITLAEAESALGEIDKVVREAKDKLEEKDSDISESNDQRAYRDDVYQEIKKIADLIKKSRKSPARMFIFAEQLDLEQLNHYMSAIARSAEEQKEQRESIGIILDLAEEINKMEEEEAKRRFAERLERRKRRKERKEENASRPAPVDEKKPLKTYEERYRDLFGENPPSNNPADAGTVETDEPVNLEDALNLK